MTKETSERYALFDGENRMEGQFGPHPTPVDVWVWASHFVLEAFDREYRASINDPTTPVMCIVTLAPGYSIRKVKSDE